MRKRILIALFAGATVFGAAFAFAAALDLGSDNLAAGDVAVGACDPDGVAATYDPAFDATAGYTVSTVTVSGIDANCAGQSVGVTLTDAAGAAIGTGTATADASGAAAVSIALAPSAKLVAGVHAVIHGAVPAP